MMSLNRVGSSAAKDQMTHQGQTELTGGGHHLQQLSATNVSG